MGRRWLLVGGLLAALHLVLPRPAGAKGLPEFEISGGGLRGSVVVGAEEIAGRVRGWVMGGESLPPALTGSAYVLDVYQAFPQPTGTGVRWEREPRSHMRWTYYPAPGGAITEEGRWVPFSPALQQLIAEAMRSASRGVGSKHSARAAPRALLTAGAVALASLLAGALALRRRGSLASAAER